MSQSPDAAVAHMKRFIVDVQQNGHYDQIEDFVHPDFIDRSAEPGADASRAGVVTVMKYIHSVISDLKVEVIHCISDGKVVATTKVFRGNQIADFFGKPATNKPIEMMVMDFLTLKEGKFVEHRATLGPVRDI